MRKLVIFSGWIPTDSPDADLWREKYISLVSDELGSYDKIIAFNQGGDPAFKSALVALDRVIDYGDVAESMDVRSDASGYQLGLRLAKHHIANYDVVLFLHSKGASHSFEQYECLADELRNDLLACDKISQMSIIRPDALYVSAAYMTPNEESIKHLLALCSLSGVTPIISICVTSSIFAVSASVLQKCLSTLPSEFLERNVEDLGYDKWLFESAFPSLLVAHGARISFTTDTSYEPLLNRNVCYSHFPKHNAAVVENELARAAVAPGNIMPTPFSFAADALLRENWIAYVS